MRRSHHHTHTVQSRALHNTSRWRYRDQMETIITIRQPIRSFSVCCPLDLCVCVAAGCIFCIRICLYTNSIFGYAKF